MTPRALAIDAIRARTAGNASRGAALAARCDYPFSRRGILATFSRPWMRATTTGGATTQAIEQYLSRGSKERN
jgi:hypothetical protein